MYEQVRGFSVHWPNVPRKHDGNWLRQCRSVCCSINYREVIFNKLRYLYFYLGWLSSFTNLIVRWAQDGARSVFLWDGSFPVGLPPRPWPDPRTALSSSPVCSASAAIYMVINFPVMYVQLFFHLFFPRVLHMCIFNREKFREPFCLWVCLRTFPGRDVVP